MSSKLTVKTKASAHSYNISIGHGLLEAAGPWAAGSLSDRPGRIIIVSNKKVYGFYGAIVKKSFETAGFNATVHLIGDGERFKNLKTLEGTLNAMSNAKLSRTDAVVALGGGVVGDLAGFAASIYLRGVAFLQIPTTLLSMIDSSVGGKTGVNTSFGKNLIGSFYQPSGVLIDTATLGTLPQREVTAGFCEAIKQGAIGGRSLFEETSRVLSLINDRKISNAIQDGEFAEKLASLLRSQVAFKARIVAGDERESVTKMDASSRKVLNFGHTLAHALEKVTNYRYLRHGEAVGYGIMFAAALSKNLGLLAQDEVKLLNDVVHRAGKLPPISNIDPSDVFATFKYDKKMINNSLHWILLEKIGKPVVFPHANIPQKALMSAFKQLARN